MKPYWSNHSGEIYHGNALEVLRGLPGESVHCCVTDPPYELGFMGKKWDSSGIAFDPDLWREVLRVLKPGAHLLAFGGTRTHHRMICAIEDAGFEIRDCIAWAYGCLSEDTEILTINGWKRYHKTIENNPVLCYDIDKDEFVFDKPEGSFIYENEHTAYSVKSNFTDQIVSRNHRCIIERGGRKLFAYAETLEQQESVPFLESLRDLPETIPNLYQGTSYQKQNLLKTVQCQEDKQNQQGQHNTNGKPGGDAINNLCSVRERGLAAKSLVEKSKKSDLLKPLQRRSAGQRVEKARPQGQGGMVGRNKRKISFEYNRGKQSCLEGWHNLFQEKRLLLQRCVNKIRQMSARIFLDGPKRRLCYGASANHGTINGAAINPQGNGTSYQPRSARQQNRKSNAFQEQQGTQAVRSTRATVAPIKYTGKVWCVQVPQGAFVARRNGRIFITGNSGFPKSLDISKAIDKRGGYPTLTLEVAAALKQARESRGITKTQADDFFCGGTTLYSWFEGRPKGIQLPTSEYMRRIADEWPELEQYVGLTMEAEREILRQQKQSKLAVAPGQGEDRSAVDINITAPATPAAQQWEGYGTALKPAIEPICLARKPLDGTVANNVLKWGCGGLNIDGCRVGAEQVQPGGGQLGKAGIYGNMDRDQSTIGVVSGRFPANLIHDGSPEVVGLFPEASASKCAERGKGIDGPTFKHSTGIAGGVRGHNDNGGTAARFFKSCPFDEHDLEIQRLIYQAKASPAERGAANNHPTVKPLSLIQYLIELACPTNGTVLDPFFGSGTTGLAAYEHGRRFIGIELSETYLRDIAIPRIEKETKQMRLFQ